MSVKNSMLKIHLNTLNLALGKFSSLQDVLNGFMLDGILGNYKEGELPLMQRNLSNVENMVPLEKSIFTFDRNYNAIEL